MKKRKEKETRKIPFSSHYYDNAGIGNVPLSCSSFCARMLS